MLWIAPNWVYDEDCVMTGSLFFFSHFLFIYLLEKVRGRGEG